MRLWLVAVGERMPAWVSAGYQEYARRMPRECTLQLVEIQAGHHGKGGAQRAVLQEGERMLQSCPKTCRKVVLDERGEPWSTAVLATKLEAWLHGGMDVALFVGGADGLSAQVKGTADAAWSLSPLTLPHGLVRVLIAEQVYRAWTILKGHPYHRA